jgi:peroxiredoxin
MFQSRKSWVAVIVAGLALSLAGCPSKPSGNANARADKHPAPQPTSESQQEPTAREAKPEEPPPPPTIPKVNLSAELRAKCLVDVGMVMPKAELPDLANKTHLLASLYGKKLTVVCFWTAVDRRSALEAANTLRSLANDVAKPFAEKGVQVIGIEVARNFVDVAASDSIRETVSKLPFPCLSDGKGQYLGRVCKDDKVPRVFLLDAEGKILWFDVEYSRSTREDLVQGIRVALGELK